MYLLRVESGIVFPDLDQLTENSLYNKDSKRFAKDHAYGEEAEVYVLDYLRKHYKKFNWYSCKEYCKIIKQDYSNKLDTLYGDIIGCFKKTGWAAIKINVKRSEKEGEIATATHYGTETDLFNSDIRGFNFYLSVGPKIENIDEWDMVWANCLVKEKPVRINNKYVWMRGQLIKYAVPLDKVLKIAYKRKDIDGDTPPNYKLWDELESLYKVLNADKLCYNNIIGKPKEAESDEIIIPTFNEQEELDKNCPDRHYIPSKYEGRFATLGENRIQQAESIAKNGKDTIFYLQKMENGVVLEDGPLEIWYSDIKDDLDNLYYTDKNSGNKYIFASKLEKYAR